MHIKRYGIRLVRLREDQIETVRRWRNADEIRSFMEFRDYITPEMQQRWFKSLDMLHDFYFVIEHQREPVGLIHTSDINWEKKTGNSGLFIWKEELQGSPIPVLASLAMVDFFFSFCTLNKLFAKVMSGNMVAVKYNAQLGFKPLDATVNKSFIEYVLERGDYFSSTARMHEMAESVGDGIRETVMENELFQSLKAIQAFSENYSGGFVTLVD